MPRTPLKFDAPVIILLIAQSMTDLIKEGSPFIANTLKDTLSSTLKAEQELGVVVAVVDQICSPLPSHLASRRWEEVRYGYEGVSVLVGEAASITPNLHAQLSIDSEEPFTNQSGSIFIEIRQKFSERKMQPSLPVHSLAVEIPLANTIFQSGQIYTLFAERWRTGPEESMLSLQLLQRKLLPRIDIVLQLPYTPYNSNLSHSGTIEILTGPRMIAACMGNIVSRLHIQACEDTEPASLELEHVLSSKATVKQSELSEVWAMIIPKEEWSNRLHCMISSKNLFATGFRFHRVQSGGGGWGNKQGLLSLDPDLSFLKNTPAGGEENYSLEGKGMKGIVRPGDVIQFFAFTRRPNGNLVLDPFQFSGLHSSRSFSFLYDPNCHDEATTDADADTTISKIQANNFFSHFGALSATGISVERRLCEHKGLRSSALTLGSLGRTKLPPWSTVRNCAFYDVCCTVILNYVTYAKTLLEGPCYMKDC